MPLKLAKERLFTWPVHVCRPEDGKWQKFEFTAHFRAFSRSELDRIGSGEVTGVDALREHLIGWEGVQDAHGQPLAFSAQSLEDALEDVDVLRALIEAFSDAAVGAERKNSKPPPGR